MYAVAEESLARYCAPVLMGRKPASLYSTKSLQIALPVAQLRRCGLCRIVIRHNRGHLLVLLYSPAMLSEALSELSVSKAIFSLGYPVDRNLDDMLRHLLSRFSHTDSFPHEIGFFLGYPPEDVIGFIQHRGQHCKLCGMWKVYGDVKRACKMFSEYQSCKTHLLSALENGTSIFDCIPHKAVAV